MEKSYNVIVFKDITKGFMDLELVEYLKKKLKSKFEQNEVCFVLMNSATPEKNQAIMQMFNGLMGFNIFKYAVIENKILKYEFLQDNQLRTENLKFVKLLNGNIESFLKENLNHKNIQIQVIEAASFNCLKQYIS